MIEEYYNIISLIFKHSDQNAVKYGIMLAERFWKIALVFIGIVIIISMFKIFKKAGEKPWKAFIPIYNLIILYKVSGVTPYILLILFLFIIPQIRGIIFILYNIIEATQEVCLCKKFKKSLLFIMCMIFFNFICYPILAFGKSEYEK